MAFRSRVLRSMLQRSRGLRFLKVGMLAEVAAGPCSGNTFSMQNTRGAYGPHKESGGALQLGIAFGLLVVAYGLSRSAGAPVPARIPKLG